MHPIRESQRVVLCCVCAPLLFTAEGEEGCRKMRKKSAGMVLPET